MPKGTKKGSKGSWQKPPNKPDEFHLFGAKKQVIWEMMKAGRTREEILEQAPVVCRGMGFRDSENWPALVSTVINNAVKRGAILTKKEDGSYTVKESKTVGKAKAKK